MQYCAIESTLVIMYLKYRGLVHIKHYLFLIFFFFQAEDGIRDLVRSRGLGDVYKRQALNTHRGLEKVLVHDTVKLLPPNFREVIELRFFQDLSVADTAKILGKESITIRVWQHRAMKQLESCLLYTSDAADERSSVDLGGRGIIKKKKQ